LFGQTKRLKEYGKLDNSVRKQIDKYLDKLRISGEPCSMGKALSADLSGLWRYRIGNYRIVVKIDNAELIVLISQLSIEV
jgi:mRNA interferase RelE/StbE